MAMLLPEALSVPAASRPAASEPLGLPGGGGALSLSSIPPAASNNPLPVVAYPSSVPVPFVTHRLIPVPGIWNPAGIVSRIRTSKAPGVEDPVFSTTTAKVTISAASGPARLLLTGAKTRPADVLGGGKRGQAGPGTTTPANPPCAGG